VERQNYHVIWPRLAVVGRGSEMSESIVVF
jgi:hypothetical protein